METTTKETKEAAGEVSKTETPKKSFGQMFMNFLMMGGFIIVLVVAAGIFILISYLTK